MNILITGGCGFIGRNLIKYVTGKEEGTSIRIVDNFSVGQPEDLKYASNDFHIAELSEAEWNSNQIDIVKGDILDEGLALKVSEGADVIVHLAANTGVGPSVEDPRSDCETNVIGTLNYLEACRINGIRKFVFASSGAPIGECNPPIHEELACHPVSPYGSSKLAGEGYCSSYFRTFGVGTVALRFGNVYGPGSSHKSSVVAKFIRQALNNETLEIYGDGKQTRDFIFTEDLVNAIWLSATKEDVGGEIFQIATNKETTVLEVTEQMLSTLEEKGIGPVNVIHGEKRLGDVLRNFSDTTKAKNQLGWESKFGLKDGIGITVDWFLTN